jgi:hypothetical protein
MDAETFKKLIHRPLKELGFKNSGATWRLQQTGSVAVLNVQKSSWSGGGFYVNLGLYFPEIEDPHMLVEKATSWFSERSRLPDAARLAESDSKKGLVFKEVRCVPKHNY